jgi:hypothetical protein
MKDCHQQASMVSGFNKLAQHVLMDDLEIYD